MLERCNALEKTGALPHAKKRLTEREKKEYLPPLMEHLPPSQEPQILPECSEDESWLEVFKEEYEDLDEVEDAADFEVQELDFDEL